MWIQESTISWTYFAVLDLGELAVETAARQYSSVKQTLFLDLLKTFLACQKIQEVVRSVWQASRRGRFYRLLGLVTPARQVPILGSRRSWVVSRGSAQGKMEIRLRSLLTWKSGDIMHPPVRHRLGKLSH